MPDLLTLLEEYIAAEKPQRWAKLSSTVNFRRLQLTLLREILLELKKITETLKAKEG